MEASRENPWAEGNCCEGYLMSDAAHIWAAAQFPQYAMQCIQQTEVFKWGEGHATTRSPASIALSSPDLQLCCDVYTLCDDLVDPDGLEGFLEDMGLLDYIAELRPHAAAQIRQALT